MNSETGGTKVSEDTDSQGVPAIAAPMRLRLGLVLPTVLLKMRRRSCLASRRVFAIMRRGYAIWNTAGAARAQVSSLRFFLSAAAGPEVVPSGPAATAWASGGPVRE
jgi:hypothetical protein